jgi:hypothetical protein
MLSPISSEGPKIYVRLPQSREMKTQTETFWTLIVIRPPTCRTTARVFADPKTMGVGNDATHLTTLFLPFELRMTLQARSICAGSLVSHRLPSCRLTSHAQMPSMRIFSIASEHVPLHVLDMPLPGPPCALTADCGPRRVEGSKRERKLSSPCHALPRSNADFFLSRNENHVGSGWPVAYPQRETAGDFRKRGDGQVAG